MRILTLYIFLLFPFWLFGQVDESDTTLFQLRTSLSSSLQKGNVELWALRYKLDLSFKPIRSITFKSQNSFLYQTIFGNKADEDIFSRNFLYHKPEKSIYPYIMTFIATNFRRKITLRYFTGVGATWQVIRSPHTVFKLSSGLIYEFSRFRENQFNQEVYNGSNRIQLWRITTWLYGRHDLFSNRLRLYYDFYGQPALNNRQNFRWQADMGVEFPLWKGLAINILYTYTHENTVVQTIKQADQILTFGLAYALKVYHHP